MSLFGPVTDAERRGWQLRAHRVLGDLLKLDLPPLYWQVGPLGSLVGRVPSHLGDQRAAFEAWVRQLNATPWPEPERGSGGVTHLHAQSARYGGLVDVAILADIVDEPAEGA